MEFASLFIRAIPVGFDATERQLRSLERQTVRTAGVTGTFSRSQQTATASTKSLGAGSIITAAALLTVGTALVRVGRTAATASLNLGRAVAETSTLIEGTTRQIRTLSVESANLAATYGGTATAQAQGFYAVLSAGASDTAEALDTLNVANRLAIGGVAELGAATQLLTGTLNAFSQFGINATEVSDIFFEVVRNGITTIPQLAASFANVSSIAAGFGVNLQTTGSAVAALTATGTQTAQATTQIRALIAALQNLNEEQRNAARELGVTSLAPANLVQIVRELEVGLGSFGSATERSTALGAIFGSQIEALSGALSLTGGGFETFQRTLDATNNSAGATSRAFAKIADSDAQRLATALGGIEEANVTIGARILDTVIPATEAWARIVRRAARDFDNVATILENQEGRATFGERFFGSLSGIADTLIPNFTQLVGLFGDVYNAGTRVNQTRADSDRLARLEKDTNSALASGLGELIDAYGGVAQAQFNSGTRENLSTLQNELSANNNLVAVLRDRRDVENSLSAEQVRNGQISQFEYNRRISDEGDLQRAIMQTEELEAEIAQKQAIRETERLSRQAGRVLPFAGDILSQFGSTLDTRDADTIAFEQFSQNLRNRENANQASIQFVQAQIAVAYGEDLLRLNRQHQRLLLNERNFNTTRAEVTAQYYAIVAGLQIDATKLEAEIEFQKEQALARQAEQAAEARRRRRETNAENRRRDTQRENDRLLMISREYAEEVDRTLVGGINSVGSSIADSLLDQTDTWESFGDSLVDIARRTVSGIIAQFTSQQLLGALGFATQGTGGAGQTGLGNLLSAGAGALNNGGSLVGTGVATGAPGAGGFITSTAGLTPLVAAGIAGAIALAAPAIVGSTRETGRGFDLNLGGDSGVDGNNFRTTRTSGLIGLADLINTGSRNRRTTSELSPTQIAEIEAVFIPARDALTRIGESFGVAFSEVSVSGANATQAVQRYTQSTIEQIDGLERFQNEGESLIDTATRLANASNVANNALANVGLGAFAQSLDGVARSAMIAAQGLNIVFNNRPVEERLAIERNNLRRDFGFTSSDSNPITVDALTRIIDSSEARAEPLRRELRDVNSRAIATQNSIISVGREDRNLYGAYIDQLQAALREDLAELQARGARLEAMIAPLENEITRATNASVGASRLANLRDERDRNAALAERERLAEEARLAALDTTRTPTTVQPAGERLLGEVSLGSSGFARLADQRVAEAVLTNTVGQTPQEMANILLTQIRDLLTDPNTDVFEALEQANVIRRRETGNA